MYWTVPYILRKGKRVFTHYFPMGIPKSQIWETAQKVFGPIAQVVEPPYDLYKVSYNGGDHILPALQGTTRKALRRKLAFQIQGDFKLIQIGRSPGGVICDSEVEDWFENEL